MVSWFKVGAAQRIVVKRLVDGALWPVRWNFETFYHAASLPERISSGINPSAISKKHKASWREDLWKLLLWFTEPGWWAELLWSGWRGGDSGCCRRTRPFLALASETHMTAMSKHGWERRHSHSQGINKKSVHLKQLFCRHPTNNWSVLWVNASVVFTLTWPPPAERHIRRVHWAQHWSGRSSIGLNNPRNHWKWLQDQGSASY